MTVECILVGCVLDDRLAPREIDSCWSDEETCVLLQMDILLSYYRDIKVSNTYSSLLVLISVNISVIRFQDYAVISAILMAYEEFLHH